MHLLRPTRKRFERGSSAVEESSVDSYRNEAVGYRLSTLFHGTPVRTRCIALTRLHSI